MENTPNSGSTVHAAAYRSEMSSPPEAPIAKTEVARTSAMEHAERQKKAGLSKRGSSLARVLSRIYSRSVFRTDDVPEPTPFYSILGRCGKGGGTEPEPRSRHLGRQQRLQHQWSVIAPLTCLLLYIVEHIPMAELVVTHTQASASVTSSHSTIPISVALFSPRLSWLRLHRRQPISLLHCSRTMHSGIATWPRTVAGSRPPTTTFRHFFENTACHLSPATPASAFSSTCAGISMWSPARTRLRPEKQNEASRPPAAARSHAGPGDELPAPRSGLLPDDLHLGSRGAHIGLE
ncbi:hypothetical protein L7F22_034401 [Adiantum nelumboides]|nr:hypothetical protein [Adiantum nelumboides]